MLVFKSDLLIKTTEAIKSKRYLRVMAKPEHEHALLNLSVKKTVLYS